MNPTASLFPEFVFSKADSGEATLYTPPWSSEYIFTLPCSSFLEKKNFRFPRLLRRLLYLRFSRNTPFTQSSYFTCNKTHMANDASS